MSDDDVAAAPSSFSCLSPASCCILPLTAQSWIVYLTFSCFLAVEMRAACASFCPLASKSCQLEWGNFPSFVGRRLLLPLFLVLAGSFPIYPASWPRQSNKLSTQYAKHPAPPLLLAAVHFGHRTRPQCGANCCCSRQSNESFPIPTSSFPYFFLRTQQKRVTEIDVS